LEFDVVSQVKSPVIKLGWCTMVYLIRTCWNNTSAYRYASMLSFRTKKNSYASAFI